MMCEEEQWKTELCSAQQEANRDLEAALALTLQLSDFVFTSVFCQGMGGWFWWAVGGGVEHPKLTSLQSSVDEISELSHESRNAVPWC